MRENLTGPHKAHFTHVQRRRMPKASVCIIRKGPNNRGLEGGGGVPPLEASLTAWSSGEGRAGGRAEGELLASGSGRPAGTPENPAAQRDISRRNKVYRRAASCSCLSWSRRRLCFLPLAPRIQEPCRAVPAVFGRTLLHFSPDPAHCRRPWLGIVGHGQTDSVLQRGRHPVSLSATTRHASRKWASGRGQQLLGECGLWAGSTCLSVPPCPHWLDWFPLLTTVGSLFLE
jgi:hypothetical protein